MRGGKEYAPHFSFNYPQVVLPLRSAALNPTRRSARGAGCAKGWLFLAVGHVVGRGNRQAVRRRSGKRRDRACSPGAVQGVCGQVGPNSASVKTAAEAPAGSALPSQVIHESLQAVSQARAMQLAKRSVVGRRISSIRRPVMRVLKKVLMQLGLVAVWFRSLSSSVCDEGDMKWQRDIRTSFGMMRCVSRSQRD